MEATNMAKSKAIFAPKVNLTKYNYTTTHKFYKSSRIMGVTRRLTLMTISSRPPHACAALVKKKVPVGVTAASEAVAFTGIAEVTVRKSGLGWMGALLAYTKQAQESQGGVTFQLVSTETYTGNTREAKVSKEAMLQWQDSCVRGEVNKVTYKVKLILDANFGVPGAILVRNNYDKEFFLESIKFEGIAHFECNSWIQPRKVYPEGMLGLRVKQKLN